MKSSKTSIKSFSIIISLLLFVLTVPAVFLPAATYSSITSDSGKYSSFYVRLNKFQSDFKAMNESIESYLSNGSSDSLQIYQENSDQLTVLCNEFNTELKINASEELAILIDSLNSTCHTYLEQTQSLVDQGNSDKTLSEFQNKYKKSSEYIMGYAEKISTLYFESGSEFFSDVENDISKIKILQISSVFIIVLIIILSLFFIISRVMKPIAYLTAQTNKLSGGNLNIPDINIKSAGEVSKLIKEFNKMKNNIKTISLSGALNLQTANQIYGQNNVPINYSPYFHAPLNTNNSFIPPTDCDPITNSLKKEAFRRKVTSAINALPKNNKCAYLIISIDEFNIIRSALTPEGADEVLGFTSEKINIVFGDFGIAGRTDKDKFTVFISQIPNDEFISQKATEICKLLSISYNYKNITHPISVSVGAAIIQHPSEIGELDKKAHEMLSKVKKAGKNGYQIYNKNDKKI